MYRAVLISLFLHLALLISPEPPWPTMSGIASSGLSGERRMAASLAAARQGQAIPTAVNQAAGEQAPSGARRQAATVQNKVQSPSVLPGIPPSTVAMPASAKTADQNVSSDAASALQPLSDEGERAYRLSLAREARKFRVLPPVVQDWQVLIAVSRSLSSVWPEVSLRRSSGFEEIDRQVLAMMAQAVKTAEIPPGLQGRQFQIVVPLEYRLTE